MKPYRKANHGTREKGALCPILDRARLRELVKDSIEQRRASCSERGKSFHVALLAKACGLTPSWLNNYLRGRSDPYEIQLKTWDGLARLVGPENNEDFESLFMPDQPDDTLGFGYRHWLQESDRLASEGTGYRWERRSGRFRAVPIERDEDGLTQRDRERDRLWSCARAKWPELTNAFDHIFEAPDWSAHRHAALTRVLEPFLQCAESGYVMRSWDDFAPEARRELIALGIRREKLMRPKSMPWARIAAAATMSIDGFVARFGVDKQAKASAFEILTEHDYGSRAR